MCQLFLAGRYWRFFKDLTSNLVRIPNLSSNTLPKAHPLKLRKSFVAIQLDLDSCLHFIKGEDNPQSEVFALSTRWVWFFVNNWTHFKANSRHWIMCLPHSEQRMTNVSFYLRLHSFLKLLIKLNDLTFKLT
jgi:hypothetical protein